MEKLNSTLLTKSRYNYGTKKNFTNSKNEMYA